jgi:hypothetical protein
MYAFTRVVVVHQCMINLCWILLTILHTTVIGHIKSTQLLLPNAIEVSYIYESNHQEASIVMLALPSTIFTHGGEYGGYV